MQYLWTEGDPALAVILGYETGPPEFPAFSDKLLDLGPLRDEDLDKHAEVGFEIVTALGQLTVKAPVTGVPDPVTSRVAAFADVMR